MEERQRSRRRVGEVGVWVLFSLQWKDTGAGVGSAERRVVRAAGGERVVNRTRAEAWSRLGHGALDWGFSKGDSRTCPVWDTIWM